MVAKGIGGVSSSGLLPQVDMFDMPFAINAVFDAFAYFHCFVFAVKHHSHSFQAVPVQKYPGKRKIKERRHAQVECQKKRNNSVNINTNMYVPVHQAQRSVASGVVGVASNGKRAVVWVPANQSNRKKEC